MELIWAHGEGEVVDAESSIATVSPSTAHPVATVGKGRWLKHKNGSGRYWAPAKLANFVCSTPVQQANTSATTPRTVALSVASPAITQVVEPQDVNTQTSTKSLLKLWDERCSQAHTNFSVQTAKELEEVSLPPNCAPEPQEKVSTNLHLFDEEDAPTFTEDDFEPYDADTQCGEEPNTSFSEVPPNRTKRIRGKSRPQDTSYAHIRPRGNKVEYTARKRKICEVRLADGKANKAAKMMATATMSKNTEAISRAISNNGLGPVEGYDWGFARQIHPSHRLRAVNSHTEAFFCERCGHYNNGVSLRSLRKPCQGTVSSERQHQQSCSWGGAPPRERPAAGSFQLGAQ